MTRRKRAKAPKPILCPACATELTPAFIRSSANSLAGSADRPGAWGLVRNPTGKREKVEAMLDSLKQPHNGFLSPEEASKR